MRKTEFRRMIKLQCLDERETKRESSGTLSVQPPWLEWKTSHNCMALPRSWQQETEAQEGYGEKLSPLFHFEQSGRDCRRAPWVGSELPPRCPKKGVTPFAVPAAREKSQTRRHGVYPHRSLQNPLRRERATSRRAVAQPSQSRPENAATAGPAWNRAAGGVMMALIQKDRLQRSHTLTISKEVPQ
jgi:hypothetical protein